eukprot:5518467-Prymnesium_polylepis.2
MMGTTMPPARGSPSDAGVAANDHELLAFGGARFLSVSNAALKLLVNAQALQGETASGLQSP